MWWNTYSVVNVVRNNSNLPLSVTRRDQSCDIWIRNRTISRKHAEVFVDDAGAVSGKEAD